MKHIISLGAGVQSSTMALMAAKGEITPMPDCAIFADTQAEPKPVYDWLDWLEKQLPFPIYRVTAGDLESASLKIYTGKSGRKYTKHRIPAFTLGLEKKGMLQRQCTLDFKIVPIKRKARELYRGEKITMWIGISLDEVVRMKPSRVKYIEHIWPLIDKRMTRHSCIEWMKKRGYPKPPRSACYFCPFHNSEEWKRLSKEDFARAVAYEKKLQAAVAEVQDKEIAVPYLHPARIPLDQVKFDSDQADLFNNECEGHCGV